MDVTNIVKIANYISSTTLAVERGGITLETGSNFDIFKDAVKKQPERGPMTPIFDPENNNFNEGNAFWIIGKDIKQEVVHTQAVRILDLNGNPFSEYAGAEFDKFSPEGWVLDSDQSHYHAAPGTCSVTDVTCYHGEFWLKGGRNGHRGAGKAVLVARIGMMISLMKWCPDFIVAMMISDTICKGLAARTGFMHIEQTNMFWAVPGYEDLREAWVAWVGRGDLYHLLNISPVLLSEQLEKLETKTVSKRAA